MEIINRLLGGNIQNYFRFCPLCHAENSVKPEISSVRGMKDYITCTACGAKWHIGIGKNVNWNAGKVNWAELEIDGIDKRGAQLLGRREKPEFWQHMALEGRRQMPEVEDKAVTTMKEKEVVREIIKVRCRHCGTLCLETSDKCPTCGAPL